MNTITVDKNGVIDQSEVRDAPMLREEIARLNAVIQAMAAWCIASIYDCSVCAAHADCELTFEDPCDMCEKGFIDYFTAKVLEAKDDER